MRPLLRVALLAVVASCTSSGSDANRHAPQLLRLVARDYTFTAPATIPAGLTRVRLVNDGSSWHEALITRLPEGVGAEAYLAGARAGDEFPVGATDVGGPGLIVVGDSSEVILRLPEGRYAIVCWHRDHVKSGMIVPLTVTAVADSGRGAAAPEADGSVTLAEYQFRHAAPFRRGPQLLHVRNEGQRPHNIQAYRLQPGRTLQDFGVWYRTRQGEPPALPVGGSVTVAPGHELWVPFTFLPGRYFIACATPEGDRIHAQLGEIEEFEIR